MGQESLFGADELPVQLAPPRAFRVLPRRLETDFCCPRCAYAWGGNPKPNAEDAAAVESAEPQNEQQQVAA